jgi:hypothetical protein
MKRIALLLAVLLASIGCGPQTKPNLIKSDTAVYTSVKAIHETAIVLGESHVITPAQEMQIQVALKPVADLGEQITRVIVAWHSGPTPLEIRQLIAELGRLVQEVGRVIPGGAGKAAILEAIATAQQAVLVLLTIMQGGG